MNSPLTLTILPTTRAHVPAIRAMTAAVGVFNAEECATVDELLDAYFAQGAAASGYHFLSACIGDHPVGFACYGPRALTQGTYDLFWIVSDPTQFRRGIGGRLLDAVDAALRPLGGRILIAETSGRAEYGDTRAFYRKYRFIAEATLVDFYAPGDDLVIFVRRLAPQDAPVA